MTLVRGLVIFLWALVAAYFVIRGVAGRCSGAACDLYIPISLFLPLVILAACAITGLAAIASARGTGWFAWLIVSTVAGVVGPLVALVVLRDEPDKFVATTAGLEVQVGVVALAYTYIKRKAVSTR